MRETAHIMTAEQEKQARYNMIGGSADQILTEKPEIPREFDALINTMQHLMKRMEELHERLAPVMHNTPETRPPQDKKPPPTTAIGERFREAAERARMVLNMVDEIHDRLAL